MPISIPTIDEIRAAIREELAAHQPPAPAPGGLIKLPKAADMFDISVRALERMGREGQIHIFQASPGGDRRVDPAQVRAALAGEKTTGQ